MISGSSVSGGVFIALLFHKVQAGSTLLDQFFVFTAIKGYECMAGSVEMFIFGKRSMGAVRVAPLSFR